MTVVRITCLQITNWEKTESGSSWKTSQRWHIYGRDFTHSRKRKSRSWQCEIRISLAGSIPVESFVHLLIQSFLCSLFTCSSGLCWVPGPHAHSLLLDPMHPTDATTSTHSKPNSGFPAGPVAKTPCSQCRGPRFNPWSENQIPHVTTKGLHAKDPACCN